MPEGSPTLGDVVRRFGTALLTERGDAVTPARRAVMSALSRCRTGTLGGHVYRCDHCGAERIAYNACRDWHCPACLGHKRAAWLQARTAELLPVPYFHVVFTVPAEVAALALGNKKVLYGILFRAAAQTLQRIARDRRHLGATIGFLAVLHTWTQTLRHHPHVHCVVPGGGLAPDGTRWIPSRARFFLPVRLIFDSIETRASRCQRLSGHTKALGTTPWPGCPLALAPREPAPSRAQAAARPRPRKRDARFP